MAQGTASNVVYVSNESELRTAVSAAATSGPVVIVFKNDISLTQTELTIPRSTDVTLKSDSTLTSESGVEFFRLIGANNANTILVDGSGTLKIDGIIVTHTSGHQGRGVEVRFNGVLELCSGQISGNLFSSSTSGGGVYNAGTFTMRGGVISDNAVNGGGGGVYNTGTFIFEFGVISSNTALRDGGGVWNTGIFSMRGGEISDNTQTSTAYNGGGVYNSGNFVFESGVISNNDVRTTSGGGVYNTGTFTMSGGVLSNNRAAYGGGVYSSGSSLKLSGVISGNTASVDGGGVYSSGGNFELSACQIFNNVAANGGGVWRSGDFSMSDVLVYDNYVSGNGGGVYQRSSGATVRMYGGEISDNAAGNNGGGVYLYYGNFEMHKGGVISKNVAIRGGGVCLDNTGLVHLYSGEVSGNYAHIGGGVWVTDTFGAGLGKLAVEVDVEFSDNRALRGYDRDYRDNVYYDRIKCIVWSDPFEQGYNNYDISYVRGNPLTEFTVTVTGTNPRTPKWTTYISNETMRATVPINAGTPPSGMTFNKWVTLSCCVEFENPYNPNTTFKMPDHPVEIMATWGLPDEHIYVSSTAGRAGGEVTLTVSLMDNPGIASYSLTMKYPSELLTFVRADNGDVLDFNFGYVTSVAGQVSVSATSKDGADVATGTTLFTVTFKIADNVKDGVIIDEDAGLVLGTFRSIDAVESGGKRISCNFHQGQIEVRPTTLYGDVNGDGVVDFLDVTRLLRCLWEVTDLTPCYAVNADVNGDGVVDFLDVTRLLRYLWEVDPSPLGPQQLVAPMALFMPLGELNELTVFGLNEPVIMVSDEVCQAGDEVTLTVSLIDNPGVASYSLTVRYPSELEFVRAARGDILEYNFRAVTTVAGQVSVSATSEDGTDVSDGTVLFTVTFRVKEGTKNGVIENLNIGFFRPIDAVEHGGARLPFSPDQIIQGIITVESDSCVHDYGVGVVTKEATCVEEGVLTFACSKCVHSYTESIPVNPDNHVGGSYEAVITEATCEVEGLMGIYCSDCNKLLETRSIGPLDHVWGEWVIVVPATCVGVGQEKRVCANDAMHVEYRVIPVAGNNHVGGTYEKVITPATVTSNGVMGIYCSGCNALLRTRVIDKLPDVQKDSEFLKERAAGILKNGLSQSNLRLDGKVLTLVIDGREFVLSTNANNRNIEGEISLGDGYFLRFDIKGNGSNIKMFEIIRK
ncbi:MAG: dockerin type I domain-containing protein [Candidatus Bathyarchaeota archaeon]|nr:dockerin type I domain-containing protein [Candidatus Termiticorpusculum sp.]